MGRVPSITTVPTAGTPTGLRNKPDTGRFREKIATRIQMSVPDVLRRRSHTERFGCVDSPVDCVCDLGHGGLVLQPNI